jgi:RNA 2',3'-cyclic 3'-phosphodiesterase
LNKEKSRRIFFALWPTDEVRENIVSAFNFSPQSEMNGRIMQPENLHMTLHFIGDVSPEKLACLIQAAKKTFVTEFEIALNYYGYFNKPKVFWMGLDKMSPVLEKLYQNLGSAFLKCEYQPEGREYSPHVTLMRKISTIGEIVEFTPINWRVNNFVLLESIPITDGVKYKVIERYSF